MSSKTYPKIREVLFFVLKIFVFKWMTFETDRKLAFRLRFSLEIIFFFIGCYSKASFESRLWFRRANFYKSIRYLNEYRFGNMGRFFAVLTRRLMG
jgi:hypothetical protein